MRSGKALVCAALMVSAGAAGAFAAGPDENAFAGHAAEGALTALFPAGGKAGPAVAATGVSKGDYLRLMAGDVDFFKKCQDERGAIIDPYSHAEVQYSTPSFAFAAAVLAKEAKRDDLLAPAEKAMSRAVADLVGHRAADKHSDFYIPLIMHAYEELQGAAAPEMVQSWREQLGTIVPEKTYRMDLRGMNWNIVSTSGELHRRQAGLVAEGEMEPQMRYMEESLALHEKDFTRFGLVHDPNSPLAYDAFSRLWLDDVMIDHTYHGVLAEKLERMLSDGALSGLLLLSPSGEWASGGRSALHNWGEGETVAICEMSADRWHARGRDDVAGAFKRAAHLAFQSMLRWQRPSGELWIIKNRAEPAARLGFEIYSANSQYNLLPMAMLGMAYADADDAIRETPTPAEMGGYVFDVRDTFHKVAAAAGGYFVLIDTDADPHYNGTGLQRVHRAGVSFPALSDSAAADRAYQPKDAPKGAAAPGIAWRNGGADAPWRSLADFAGSDSVLMVKSAVLHTAEASPEKVAFDLTYALAGLGEDGREVVEHYVISRDGVECTSELTGAAAAGYRAEFPVLVNDGAADLPLVISQDGVKIDNHGSTTSWTILSEGAGGTALAGPRLVTHNGYVQKAVAGLAGARLHYRVTLTQ